MNLHIHISLILVKCPQDLCVIGVPLRFDKKKLNFHVSRFNAKLKSHFKFNCKNSVFLDVTRNFKPKDYNRDGIHLNTVGKLKLCNKIKNVLSSQSGELGKSKLYNLPLPSDNNELGSSEILPCDQMVPSTSKAYVENTIGTLKTESSDNENDVTIISHDLTDPVPHIDNTHHSFLTASMMQDTILFVQQHYHSAPSAP
uniref:Uncharacterized protein n=1 Tax=Cacopsylla melanoneura TaxID=428564 RepID=A0A8D9DVT1_9HEMI